MKKNIILVIVIKGLLFSLIEMPLFCQTPLITNVKQIKPSVRSEIVSTSSDFVSLKNDVATSTTSLQNAISNEAQARIDAITNLNVALSSETQARTNTDNILTSQIQSLQAQSTNYVLRGGDTLNGNYIFNNNVGIGTNSPETKLDIIGNIKITDGTQGAGKVLTSDANGLATWQTPAGGSGDNLGNHIATMTLDMAGFDINNVKQLTINGDTASGQSWLSMYQNNSYLSGNGSNILNIINFSKITSPNANLGLGVSNPSYKLDVNGDINFTGTLYKNGIPFGGGSGDNLGNHIATTTLDMNNNWINNVNWITFYGADIGIDTNYEYSKIQIGKTYSNDVSGISIGDYTITTIETNPPEPRAPEGYNPSGNIAIGILNKSAGTNNIVLGEYSDIRGHNNIAIGQHTSLNNITDSPYTGKLNIGNLITGQIVVDNSNGDTSWVYFNTTGGTYSTSPFYVQDSTSATKQLCLVGSVGNLPTKGFNEGCFVYNYTEHKVYISTENVVGLQSWKSLW